MADCMHVGNLNREYFDHLAAEYNTQPWQKQLTTAVTREIHTHLSFIFPHEHAEDARRDLRLLDYACGHGMITRSLPSRCSEAVGIDISSAMVERYQALMESYPVPGMKASAYVGNMFTQETPQEFQDAKFYNFDMAAVGFGFHHFDGYALCMKRLTERLRPGGTVLIVDFCVDGAHLPASAGVTSHGFSEASMTDIFEGAGLINTAYYRVSGEFEMHMHGNQIHKSVFLARATKPDQD